MTHGECVCVCVCVSVQDRHVHLYPVLAVCKGGSLLVFACDCQGMVAGVSKLQQCNWVNSTAAGESRAVP